MPAVKESKSDVRNLIGQFTTMSLAFRDIYYPFLTTKWETIQNESWFNLLINKEDVNLADDEFQYEIEKIKLFLDDFLEWISSLILNSKGFENEKISLINCEQFSSLDSANKYGDVVLHDELSKQQIANFSNLVQSGNFPSLSNIFTKLNYPTRRKNRSGLGVFFGELYESCCAIERKAGND